VLDAHGFRRLIGPSLHRSRPLRPGDRIEHHEDPGPVILEPVGKEPRDEVGGLIEAWQRPRVRDPVDDGEQR
jgi:hypothetical protein